jgi:hypothetical protein
MATRFTGDASDLLDATPSVKGATLSQSAWRSPESLVRWLTSAEGNAENWENTGRGGKDLSFTGGATFPQACDMVLQGWPEGAARVAALRDKINAANPTGPRLIKWDVAGAVANVPRALSGNPLNMRRIDSAKLRRRPVITVVSHYGAIASVDAATMSNRAAVVAAAVDAIEAAGFSCRLIAWAASTGSKVTVETAVLLKDAGQHVDVARIAFGLGHPAMLRRLTFAVRGSRKECRPMGRTLGYTIYDGLTVPDGCYLLPAIQQLGEENFETEQAAMSKGLPAVISALQKQGCPAFPADEYRAA